MRTLIAIFILCLMMVSCVEPFDIEDVLQDKAGKPVINGWISNFPYDYRVYVAHTVSINDTVSSQPVSDAIVVFKSEKNNLEDSVKMAYDAVESNYYFPTEFTGEEGKLYWIEVTFPNGEIFQSSPELLQPAPPIESVSLGQTFEFKEHLNDTLREVIVKFNDPPDERNYYLWVVDNFSHSDIRSNSFLYVLENDVLYDKPSRNVSVSKAIESAVLLVRQLSLSRTGYKFFQLLNRLDQSSEFDADDVDDIDPIFNGLFAEAPLSLEGNIFEKGNKSNFGSGYFGVYGQSQKFFSGKEPEPLQIRPSFENTCQVRISNGVLSSDVDFFHCLSASHIQAEVNNNWQSFLLHDNNRGIPFFQLYFDFKGSHQRVTLHTNSRDVKFESRPYEVEVEIEGGIVSITVDNLYLSVKKGFSGEAELEIRATDFFHPVQVVRYTVRVDG